jgi:hypothetical protein
MKTHEMRQKANLDAMTDTDKLKTLRAEMHTNELRMVRAIAAEDFIRAAG